MNWRWISVLAAFGAVTLLLLTPFWSLNAQSLLPGTASVPLPDGNPLWPFVQLDDGSLVRLAIRDASGEVTLRLIRLRPDGGGLETSAPIEIGVNCWHCETAALATDGSRVALAWEFSRPGDGLTAIALQLFDEGLRPLISPIQVTGTSNASRFEPSLGANADSIVVAFRAAPPVDEVWQRTSLFARRFDWSGQPIGSPFRVDAPPLPGALERGVEAIETLVLPNGDAVFAWLDRTGGEGTLGDVRTTAVDIMNWPVAFERVLGFADEIPIPQRPEQIVELDNSSYAILWTSGENLDRTQRFSSSHLPSTLPSSLLEPTPELPIVYASGATSNPADSALEDGLVVSWRGDCREDPEACSTALSLPPGGVLPDGDGSATYARSYRFESTGVQGREDGRLLEQQTFGNQYARMMPASPRVRSPSRWFAFHPDLDVWSQDDPRWRVRPMVEPCQGVQRPSFTACTGRDRRFRIDVWWRDFEGREGRGSAQRQNEDLATFRFFTPGQPDLLIKVLDAESITDSHWIFLASLSNVEFEVYVTDTQSGLSRVYRNPSGTFASLGDVPGLRQIDPGETYDPTGIPGPPAISSQDLDRQDEVVTVPDNTTCVPNDNRLCFTDRFAAEVTWTDFSSRQGPGMRFALSDNTGAFWFFDPSNPELTVKMLDGRSINGHWWVYLGALTNVGFSLEITDLVTGERRTWTNQVGNFASFGDVEAFPDP